MLDATKLFANALGEHLALVYRRTFGSREPGTIAVIEESARLTIERIVQSDALDHDAGHTTAATFIAQGLSPA
ncbi:hypothetical protein [uncultured Methylobacterium sp.]|uniref:hypothetical protein n=1 Tax=uncultured Methylobacterium sp. TaxID=157278 RepID=UPI0035CB26BF